MRLKNSIKFYVICIMLVGICFGKGKVAKAADTANVTVKSDVEYSQYDVNGDGKADTIKMKTVNIADNKESGMIQIFVNDKITFEQKRAWSPVWNVKLIKLANGKIFFDIESLIMYDSNCIHRLYICENNKLKCVYDFQKYYDKYATRYSVNIAKVSGNMIKTEVRPEFYVTGVIQYDMNISFKDGKFKRTSTTFVLKYKAMSMKNKWTAVKKIKVCKKAGSTKAAYTLKKGKVVKLNKVIYKNNKVYFQVKNNKGKTGYIPASKTLGYFKEARVSQ
ncbi:MAG: hypothetical protein HFJ09_15765 [Lachnospiraceae bacterium]|nr:hypothetical protein [Lachnospiraceae bacterium]